MNGNLLYLSHNNRKIILWYTTLAMILFGIAFIKQYRDNIASTLLDMCCIMSTFVVLYALCDLIIRLFFLLGKNWNCDTIKLLRLSFRYNIVFVVVVTTCSSFFIAQTIYEECAFNYIQRCNSITCMLLYCFVFISLRMVTLSPQYSNRDIASMNGLDYGTGMAYSYYYGYLRIILPSTGTASKGILEKIDNYEDNHNVSIAVKKLFILIPSSTYVPPDLKELSYQWMESAQELEEEVRNRAGIKRRSYHNNVYKIYPGGDKFGTKPVYVLVEGATPVLTFFEVQKHFHPESATYKKYREEIIMAFYEKLKELIYNNPDCKDVCELIYYKDLHTNGNKVNVAEIILQRIEKLKGHRG